MKKIIRPAVPEESERVCDVTGKPAIGRLVLAFDYGSVFDGDGLDVDLSDEVAADIVKLLRTKYPQLQPKPVDSVFHCPWCHRGP